MPLYIVAGFKRAPDTLNPTGDLEITILENLEDLEKLGHTAFRMYEYDKGSLTELYRKPVFRKVMREIEEIDGFTISAKAVSVPEEPTP